MKYVVGLLLGMFIYCILIISYLFFNLYFNVDDGFRYPILLTLVIALFSGWSGGAIGAKLVK